MSIVRRNTACQTERGFKLASAQSVVCEIVHEPGQDAHSFCVARASCQVQCLVGRRSCFVHVPSRLTYHERRCTRDSVDGHHVRSIISGVYPVVIWYHQLPYTTHTSTSLLKIPPSCLTTFKTLPVTQNHMLLTAVPRALTRCRIVSRRVSLHTASKASLYNHHTSIPRRNFPALLLVHTMGARLLYIEFISGITASCD